MSKVREVWKWEEVEKEIDKRVPLRKIYSRIRREQLVKNSWWS